MKKQHAALQRTLPALIILGLLPAAPIGLLFGFHDQQWTVFGQGLPGFDMPRLFAALISTVGPLYLLIPVIFHGLRLEKKPAFWLVNFAAPFCLLGPVALLLITKSGWSALPWLALLLMGLLTICFSLWLHVLARWLAPPLPLLFYGVFWAGSGFLHYLVVYVIPYQDIGWLQALTWIRFIVPQIGDSLGLVDAFLSDGSFSFNSWAPTFLQIPLLALTAFVPATKDARPIKA